MYLHLYEGYKNIVDRVLEYREGAPRPYNREGTNRIDVALQASERFERLSDRIHLLVISALKELIEEKDALISTVRPLSYFFHHSTIAQLIHLSTSP